ncbi:hypothetical protein DICVIV_05424 [Dictyocaulus viviparus]|uniref:G-protein coupled receptors family 1 profile domain-containing protein n=1 Tax=Dictyocaulus viviparus TaxID=29172 RepID=A0A0D8XXF9_DICVI|nr:hypothetical protein DICVIV_05424 [Dictyocaulus viviparus]
MNSNYRYSLVFPITTKKALVGSGYLVLGLFGVCLNLSTLSILPECEQSLGRPLLIFFSIQLFIAIGTLIFVAIPVPCMIATNRPYIMNPLLSGAPGLLICFTLVASFVLQFCICMYRSVRIVFNRTTQCLFPDVVMQIIIGVAFLLSVHISVTITQSTNVRRFSLIHLNWQQSDHEYISLLTVVVYFSLASLMFYALSIFHLLYEHIYDKNQYKDSTIAMKTQLLCLICDIIFATLLMLPRIDEPSKYPNLTILHSILNIIGAALWPTAYIIMYSKKVRTELCFRTFLMCSACSRNKNTPSQNNRIRVV